MRSKSTFLFLVTILLASCAAPMPQATVTAVPSSTPTTVPTSTPAPTETLEPTAAAPGDETPPAPDISLPSMAQFERQDYWEQGKSVAVEDLYGAGAATITVEKVTTASPGQVLDYQELDTLDQPSGDFGGITLNRLKLMNLTVEATSLLRVDVQDNTQLPDGAWCVMRLGTRVNGQKTSFEVVVSGNVFNGTTGESICQDWSVGDIAEGLILSYFPTGGVTLEHIQKYRSKNGLDASEASRSLFELLGEGSNPTDKATILEVIKTGGILDKSMVHASNIK